MAVYYLLPYLIICGIGVFIMAVFAVRRLMGIVYERKEGINEYHFASVPPFLMDAAYWFHNLVVIRHQDIIDFVSDYCRDGSEVG